QAPERLLVRALRVVGDVGAAEADHRPADADDLLPLQQSLSDLDAVDGRAVGGVEIRKPDAARLELERDVSPGHLPVVEANLTKRALADQHPGRVGGVEIVALA